MLQLVVVFIAWKTKGVNFNVVSFLKSEAANPQVKITYKLTINSVKFNYVRTKDA